MMGDKELALFYAGYTKKVASADEDDLLFSVSAAEAETLTASQTRFLAAHVDASSGRILDIGCGKGAFLRSFRNHRPQWHSVGIEPSREEAELARRDGQLEVHEGMLGSTPLERESFDLVSIMHVFEHVPRPIETLRHMHDLLKPGGMLFIEVPNTSDPNMFYDLLLFEHLFHFTPETLAWLLSREGFEVVVHERSTAYGAQRVIARKAGRSSQVSWPELTMADGFARWQQLWASMSQLAAHGASAAHAGQRVGIFGAGMTAATWLVHTPLSDAPLVGLFDESQWKIGQTLFDRQIHRAIGHSRAQARSGLAGDHAQQPASREAKTLGGLRQSHRDPRFRRSGVSDSRQADERRLHDAIDELMPGLSKPAAASWSKSRVRSATNPRLSSKSPA